MRARFPALSQQVHGRRLAYLDNAATTQKPREVIDAITRFYETDCANVHRGAHELSARASDAYERARARAARFLHARSEREIVFTRGATEAINLVARGLTLPRGAQVLVTTLEHHANFVPWQRAARESGAIFRAVPLTPEGRPDLDAYGAMLAAAPTAAVAITHVSNVLGTVVPVREMTARAHEHGAVVLIDGAQAAAHTPIDVQEIGADFYTFSAHKVYGPFGAGVLHGKAERLAALPPLLTGGGMVREVSLEETTFAPVPARFEAGTPDIPAVIGLAAALDFVTEIGFDAIRAHERALLSRALDALAAVPGLRVLGAPEAAIVSFVLDGVHPHDLGTVLDRAGVAVRVGHHCARPLMDHLAVEATARASFAVYNDDADLASLVEGLHEAIRVLRR